MDDIQHYLHDELGKQQITFSFNNYTRYLKFVKAKKLKKDGMVMERKLPQLRMIEIILEKRIYL